MGGMLEEFTFEVSEVQKSDWISEIISQDSDWSISLLDSDWVGGKRKFDTFNGLLLIG